MKELNEMTKDELIEYAEENGIEVDSGDLKKEIFNTINEAMESDEAVDAQVEEDSVNDVDDDEDDDVNDIEDDIAAGIEEVEESLPEIDLPKLTVTDIVNYLHSHKSRDTHRAVVDHFKSIRAKLDELINKYGE